MKNISKRLLKEKKENEKPGDHFYIQPLPNDYYTWHFTFLGFKKTPYKDGIYHGKIVLPKNYPISPPDIYYLNQSGRYEVNKKICLTITSYHKEQWTPAWNMRTVMEAITAFFYTEGSGIGYMKGTPKERQAFAIKSRDYKCTECGKVTEIEKLILNHQKK